MLFNSHPFILLFLPVVLAGYFGLGRRSNLAPVIWLALASLVFYAIGSWQFVALLLALIAFNYGVGHLLIVAKLGPSRRKAALALGVAGDLVVLGIFKYAGFATENINALAGTHLAVHILLPVGISFYTFTQIAFLVDAYRGQVAANSLPHYALFVTYFPHLIAGPILHHKDMIPQFERASKHPDAHRFCAGSSSSRSACSRRPALPTASSRWSRSPSTRARRVSTRHGSVHSPMRSSSISISPAIPTWRSGYR